MATMKRQSAASVMINKSLFLCRQPVNAAPAAVPSVVPVDFVLVVDISGSMAYELDRVRADMKTHLRAHTNPGDTVTLVAFSGDGQCFSVFDAEPIATLPDVDRIDRLIDRWVKPIGMTNFVEPFNMAEQKLQKLGGAGRAVALLFMSDGCETCGNPLSRVLGLVDRLADKVGSWCVVEYGSWADHHALDAIAKRAGGVLVASRDFRQFAPTLDAFLSRRPIGAKKINVPITGDAIDGFVFALDGDAIPKFEIISGQVQVPEGITEVFYLSPTQVGERDALSLTEHCMRNARAVATSAGCREGEPWASAAYAAMAAFGNAMNSDVVEDVLAQVGDLDVARRFGATFGIESYLTFIASVSTAAIKGRPVRFAAGYQANCVPPADIPTIVDVFEILRADPETRMLTPDPRFVYKRIARGQIDATTHFTTEEQAKLDALRADLGKTADVDRVREITEQIEDLLDSKGIGGKFTPAPAPDGYPIDDLVTAADRPNISFRIRRNGVVDIAAARKKAIADAEGKDEQLVRALRAIPDQVIAYDYKTYNVLRDGRLNVPTLPVLVSEATWWKLAAIGVVTGAPTREVVLQLEGVAVVNRKMKGHVTPHAIFGNRYRHIKAQAAAKVYGDYRTMFFGKAKSQRGLVETFGVLGAEWLAGLGLTDGGWRPKRTPAPPTGDTYRAKVVKVSIAGLSSLPTTVEVLARRAKIATEAANGGGKSKLTPSMALMVPAIEAVEAKLVSLGLKMPSDLKSNADNDPAALKTFEAWIESEERRHDRIADACGTDSARFAFAIAEAHAWPWKDPKQTEDKVDIDGDTITGRIDLSEPDIAL